jgi:hypothetical protein
MPFSHVMTLLLGTCIHDDNQESTRATRSTSETYMATASARTYTALQVNFRILG